MRIRTSAACVLILFSGFVEAQKSRAGKFVPAKFADGQHSILNQLQCPKDLRAKEMVGVYCQATVDDRGKVRRVGTYCFGHEADNNIQVRAAQEALIASRFSPAAVGDEAVEVSLAFRLFYSYQDDPCTVFTLPNLGYQHDKFGYEYTAPQEITGGRDLYYRSNRAGNGRIWNPYQGNWSQPGATMGVMFVLSVDVSESGVASADKIVKNNLAWESPIRAIRQALVATSFIPGTYNGEPVAMKYYLFWHSYGRIEDEPVEQP